MLRRFALTPGLVVLALQAAVGFRTASAQEFIVPVNGATNAIFGGAYVAFSLPEGTTTYVVYASGAAYYAPGRLFAGLIMDRKTGSYTELIAVAIPSGVPVEITDSGPDQRAELFFVDDDRADNSGSFQVTITPNAGAPLTFEVSASQHCIDVSRAASIDLPIAVCDMQASGSAWWAGPGHLYKTVVGMYDDDSVPPKRTFSHLEVNGSRRPLLNFLGGPIRLFFADLQGEMFDNGGDVLVTFRCDPQVPVRASTWGVMKHLWTGDTTP